MGVFSRSHELSNCRPWRAVRTAGPNLHKYLFYYFIIALQMCSSRRIYSIFNPLVLPICPLAALHSPQIPRSPSANLISSASQMDSQPQFEPALHLKPESASAYEFSLDMDHRRRRRNRTTQSCLNCHTSKRKVRHCAPSSSSCPSFRHFCPYSVTVSALVNAAFSWAW
jgi:hypothetical protein